MSGAIGKLIIEFKPNWPGYVIKDYTTKLHFT